MKKIYLIAGHNGAKTGASSKFLDEGVETIILRDLIYKELKALDSNLEVVVDNEREKLIPIVSWLKSIVKSNDICLDIHFNAFNSSTYGTEVLIPKNPSNVEKNLATKILNTTVKVLGTQKRGVKTEDKSQYKKLAMLSGFNCTNILWEVEFLDNEFAIKKYINCKSILAKEIAKILYEYSK